MARRIDGRNTLRAVGDALLLEMFDYAAAGWKLGRVRLTTRQRSDRWTSGRAWPAARGRGTQLHLSLAHPDKWRPAVRGAYHYAINNLGPSCRFVAATLEEEALFVIAHEVRHLIQGRYRNYGKVWGARGKYSERDADAFAVRICRQWRRERGIVGQHRGAQPGTTPAAKKADARRAAALNAPARIREWMAEATDCVGDILDGTDGTRAELLERAPWFLEDWPEVEAVNVAAVDRDGVYHYVVRFTRAGVFELDGGPTPRETGNLWGER